MRRVGTRAFDEDEPRPAEAQPRDAGTLAAGEALKAALGRDLTAARGASLVVLRVPDPSWIPPVRDAWAALVEEGREPRRLTSFRSDMAKRDGRLWTAALQEGRSPLPVEELERALALGLRVIVVAHGAAWTPPLVSALADLSAVLEPLPWRALRYVATRAAGAPSARDIPEPSASVLAAVSPRVLRLAARPLGGAEGLLRRALAAAASTFTPAPRQERDGPRGLARVPGMGLALPWGRSLAADLRAYRAGALSWRDIDRGALLAGPPGTGKSTFARALAEEAGVPLVATGYAKWQGAPGGHLGTTLDAMQRTFAAARAAAPCLLFIDELDSFPTRDAVRHDHADYVRSVVNGLLQELDGALGREGVVVLGACNNPSIVEPAILRSGRLERVIIVGLPNAAAVEEILRVHLAGDLPGADLSPVAREGAAMGVTGADVERLVREARRAARAEGAPLHPEHVLDAVVGNEEERSPEELRRTAIHEAGHAVATVLLRPGKLVSASVRAADGRYGTVQTIYPGQSTLTAEGLHGLLVEALAGRAAEEAAFGAPSAGAGGGPESDLARATALAVAAAASLGFEADSGLAWRGAPSPRQAARVMAADPSLASIVRARLDAAYRDALDLVRRHERAVRAVAGALMLRGTLDGATVAAVVAEASTTPAAAA